MTQCPAGSALAAVGTQPGTSTSAVHILRRASPPVARRSHRRAALAWPGVAAAAQITGLFPPILPVSDSTLSSVRPGPSTLRHAHAPPNGVPWTRPTSQHIRRPSAARPRLLSTHGAPGAAHSVQTRPGCYRADEAGAAGRYQPEISGVSGVPGMVLARQWLRVAELMSESPQ